MEPELMNSRIEELIKEQKWHELRQSLGEWPAPDIADVVGPFIIWGPAALYLFIDGAIFRGISLAVMGAFGISLVDNLLRPMIIGNRTKIPFLAIFFSVLGGIKLFGIIGVIMGPLVLVLFLSVIEIFRSMEESSDA